MNDNNKEIDKILDAFEGREELTDDETLALLDTEEGQRAWDDIHDLDEAANRAMGTMPDIDAAWADFEKKNAPKGTQRRHAMTLGMAWKALAAAAAVALLIIMVRLNYPADIMGEEEKETVFLDSQEEGTSLDGVVAKPMKSGSRKLKTIEVPTGATKDLVLPDGTKVCLNAKSTLTYDEAFDGKTRRVNLKGEGYFKVSHDKKRPFIIKTDNVTTRVLGTEFNVRCYDADDIHVTLVEGSVEVASNINKVTISPNQDARLAEGRLVVANVNPKDFTSWREGLMYFDNATLRTILHQIGAWYNVSVVCDKSSLLDLHFHFMFNKNDSIEDVIRLFTESSDLEISLEDNTLIIK